MTLSIVPLDLEILIAEHKKGNKRRNLLDCFNASYQVGETGENRHYMKWRSKKKINSARKSENLNNRSSQKKTKKPYSKFSIWHLQYFEGTKKLLTDLFQIGDVVEVFDPDFIIFCTDFAISFVNVPLNFGYRQSYP